MSRRQAMRIVSALASAGALTALASCAARSAILPQGWERVLTHDVMVPVRSEWEHRPAPEGLPLWDDLWVAQDASVHLLIGSPTASSHEDAFVEARAALRAPLPGYSVVTTTSTATQSDRTLSMEDFTTRSPGFEQGRLWLLSGPHTAVAVALAAVTLPQADCEVVVDGLRPAPVTGFGTAREGWGRVGREALTVLVPDSWRVLGPVPGSERWRDSWADADPDGLSRARLLLCPDTGARTLADALARIESDSVAGAVPGYRIAAEREHQVNGAGAVRRDFLFDDGSGALWVIDVGGGVGAVQLTAMDTVLATTPDLVRDIEEGLWVTDSTT